MAATAGKSPSLSLPEDSNWLFTSLNAMSAAVVHDHTSTLGRPGRDRRDAPGGTGGMPREGQERRPGKEGCQGRDKCCWDWTCYDCRYERHCRYYSTLKYPALSAEQSIILQVNICRTIQSVYTHIRTHTPYTQVLSVLPFSKVSKLMHSRNPLTDCITEFSHNARVSVYNSFEGTEICHFSNSGKYLHLNVLQNNISAIVLVTNIPSTC